MRLGRITAITISLILELTTNCVRSWPVTMYVKQEANSQNYLHVNFYNDTFQKLYQCMTYKNSQQCFVQTVYENIGTPFPAANNYKVVNVTSIGISQQVQSSFTCLYSMQATALECTRNTSQCGGNTRCTLVRLRSSPICQCVYLIWQYLIEDLVFYNKTHNIEYCEHDCTQATTVQGTDPSIETTVHSTESSSHPSELSSDATMSASNSTNIASSGGDQSSNSVPVIIGVVLCVLVIAVIVIVVGLIYRRQKKTQRPVGNNGNNSSHTNASFNGGPVRNNALNIPDVLSTLPYSSHGSETNRESEDGYYTTDKVYGLNRYENALSTVSSMASQRPDEGVVISRGLNIYNNEVTVSPDTLHTYESDAGNSEMSHAQEGDYFTIDPENDGEKPKAVQSVLNSHHLNKYTNVLRVSPQTLHIYEDDAVKPEPLHAPEQDYFSLKTENDFGEDDSTADEEQTPDGGYSLAKDVDNMDEAPVVDVIDVSPPPKNIYSKLGDNNNTDMKNPYDKLLEKHQILNSRKI